MLKVTQHKVERFTYCVIIIWLIMGVLCAFKTNSFTDLSVYFLSFTGFAATYVFCELKRPSRKSALFYKGPSSKREKMMYILMIIWFILGTLGIIKTLNLSDMAAYFASLTPFVSAFILGETFRPELAIRDQLAITNTAPETEQPAEDTPQQ